MALENQNYMFPWKWSVWQNPDREETILYTINPRIISAPPPPPPNPTPPPPPTPLRPIDRNDRIHDLNPVLTIQAIVAII